MKDIEYTFKNKTGIYCIFNMINGKRYIGSSIDIYNRLHEHYHNLQNNKAHNKHLQAAWNKYGSNAFKFEVLEYCNEQVRFNREQYYLDMMNPEYNFTPVVTPNLNRIISDDIRLKISNTLKQKYASGELQGKYYGNSQINCYVYNVLTWTLAAECSTLREAIMLLYGSWAKTHTVGISYILNSFIRNTYIVTREPLNSVVELKNYFYKNFCKLKQSSGKYLKTIDINGNIKYYKTFTSCAAYNNVKEYKIRLKCPNDVLLPNGTKCMILNEYQEIIETAVPIEKSMELLSGKIGESCNANTEVTL